MVSVVWAVVVGVCAIDLDFVALMMLVVVAVVEVAWLFGEWTTVVVVVAVLDCLDVTQM